MWNTEFGRWEHYRDGELFQSGKGYSGGGNGENAFAYNNPRADVLKDIGPAPAGTYIAERRTSDGWIRLWPAPDNQMYGRDDIFIHGDAGFFGDASRGCLIIQQSQRKYIRTGTMVWIK
ncbi:tlde1 domain-containing protein [Teredinibacter purpureus]|uniref:tlde1 domain-containing protein n=1 Tax=Teredinibacter purpureus TaxID=2731756 RepID=UPI0005F787FC|nr:tlde1 domain-containing protein [Teredinibacter purpureus]